jgi:hypothetical protein
LIRLSLDCHRSSHALRDTVTLSEEDDLRRMTLKLLRRDCRHTRSTVATSAGVLRKVCEACGHISFEMTTPIAAGKRTRIDEAVGI